MKTSEGTAVKASGLAQQPASTAAAALRRRSPLRAVPVGSSFCRIVDEHNPASR